MRDKHDKIKRFKIFFVQNVVMLLVVSALTLFNGIGFFLQYGTKIQAQDALAGKEYCVLAAADAETVSAVNDEKQMWNDRAELAKPFTENSQDSVSKKVVVIDAGHGGSDTGTYTQDKSVIEKDCTLEIVKQLKLMLDDIDDIEVYYTRLEDKTVSKEKRLKFAHEKKADLFISIHCNAGNWGDSSSYGTEALYSSRKYKGTSLTGKKLAQKLADNVSRAVDGRDRGVRRRDDLYILGHSKVPVSIVEVGYMSSPRDVKYIKSVKGQKKVAGAVRDTIVDILG